MRDATDVVHCEDFTVSAVTCRDDHAGWSAAEPAGEVLVDLLARAVAQVAVGATPTGPADRAAVDAARAAVPAEHPDSAGLVPPARLVGVSPHRLSRAFSREVGMSLTRFRDRVRVGRALDRLEAGERDLAGLAADLGFADQAHLTRTVRAHVGWTPAALAPSTTGALPPGARRAGW
ncbi:helix-turn-helix domain-containing protein [Saccharothrix coeruleofusca]|uniref:helix-turn-helix domain-containing protein n=1 Tax=Saccharothrix coeruleofusca TaxID=33919 RepID=UPI001E50FE40|nr:AraC family transcriptional regulator [Saccharothrix coeruleofusca]